MRKIKLKNNRKGRRTFYLILISLIFIQFYQFPSFGGAAIPVRTDISVNIANEMINNNTAYPDLLILDVRNIEEFNTNHLHNATLIPLSELESRLDEIALYNNSEIVVYCRSGSRSLQASNILVANNFTKIFNMLGGITAWIDAGFDYWLNEEAMSIDFLLPVFLISLMGIIFVLVFLYSRKWKLVKRY